MTDSEIFERAQAIIRDAAILPDPVEAMEALEAQATPAQAYMFPMLWEGLSTALAAAMEFDDAPGEPQA